LKAGTIEKGRKIEISYLKDDKQTGLRKLTRLKSKYTKVATTHKNRVNKIFLRNNIRIFDIFKQNKFTQTAVLIYLAIAEDKGFDDFVSELESKKTQGSQGERSVYSRTINFIQKNQKDIEEIMKSGVINELAEKTKLNYC
jgi:hypothetical protein